MIDRGKTGIDQWILTFDQFLTTTPFIDIMAKMLKTLQRAYGVPVDIEFTVNYNQADEIQVNLLQCRPFQTTGNVADVVIPEQISVENILIRTEGRFMGGNVSLPISCVIWVDPENYAELSLSEKYSVARLIGKLNRLVVDRKINPTLLVGPGRWGTHTPAMGVPVTFSEINHITALAEMSYQDGSLIPDLSFGTHFFHDLTETNIFYMAVYPEDPSVLFNPELLQKMPNTLKSISPLDGGLDGVVKVYYFADKKLMIRSNVISQKMICYHMQEVTA